MNLRILLRYTELLLMGILVVYTIHTLVHSFHTVVYSLDTVRTYVIDIAGNNQNSTLKESGRNSVKTDEHFESYSRWLEEYEAKIIPGLGKDGEAAKLSPEEAVAAQEIRNRLGMNILLSDKISLSRTLLDPRDPLCKNVTYSNNLPKASVIIIFHNEPLSLLLRTATSVFNRTPKHLVQEIMLVDDASTDVDLHEKLDYFISKKFDESVKLLRLPERGGLIKTRLAGARKAVGDVLVFLDAHCEVTVQWLEPMLERIREKKDVLVTPVIDTISQDTYEYDYSPTWFPIASFDWSAWFEWVPIPEREIIRRKSPISPVRTPAMAGGLFAIDREYFWKIGSYDEKMTGWGGENLEMAFRIWQCGGSLETIPCSRVGHAYRAFRPYNLTGDTFSMNAARFIKVWTDEYKWLFFLYNEDMRNYVNKIDDISDRIELRKKLNCKSFKWYLNNVAPEKFVPSHNATGYGRVRVKDGNICLDSLQRSGDSSYNLGVYACHEKLWISQLFVLTNAGELRREYSCAVVNLEDVDSRRAKVKMVPCQNSDNQKEWMLTQKGTLIHASTGLCLDGTGLNSGDDTHVTQCSRNIPGQLWQFEFHGDENNSQTMV